MKKEITAYVARCDNCCRVKAIHMKPARLLQPLSIPGWKWEEISMDFIVGLPPTQKNFNSIWIIVDHLTKSAHFIPVRIDYQPSDYAELYFNQIVHLHRVPRTIVSDRGPQFTAHFFGTFAQDVRHQLSQKFCLSSNSLQTDGASESNIGRHVKSLCHIFKGFMGKVATFSKVCLQQ